jgi:hypothetical protein
MSNRDVIKQTVSSECGVEYVGLSEIKDSSNYFTDMGTKVYDVNGNVYIIEHDGAATHPGDKTMKLIASKIYEQLEEN